MFELPPHEFQRFVGLLKQADAFRTRRERQAFLEAALAEHEDAAALIRGLNLDGSVAVVAEGVVRDLEGVSIHGVWAVAALADQLLRRSSYEPSDRSFLLRLSNSTRGSQAPDAVTTRSRREYQPSHEQVLDYATGRSSRRRIFILHSHGNPDDDVKVEQIAKALEDEFDVVVDFKHDTVQRGWFLWSAKEYNDADFVLIAASREWCRRFTDFVNSEHPERYAHGQGVRFEANLITADIARLATGRLLLVFFDDEDRASRPRMLFSLNHFMWPSDEQKIKSAVRSSAVGIAGALSDDVAVQSGFVFRSPALDDPTQFSRLPIVIAVEAASDPLTADALLSMERHMLVTLSDDQVTFLENETRGVADSLSSIEELHHLGESVWRVFDEAQPRLQPLLERAAEEGVMQPVAWTGFADLLFRISRAVSIASGPSESSPSVLSLACGAYYFSPLARTAGERNINARPARTKLSGASTPAVKVRRFATTLTDVSGSPELTALGNSEVAILSAPSIPAAAMSLAASLEAAYGGTAPTARAVMAFGHGDLAAPQIERLLGQVPCVSIGGETLRHDDLLSALDESVTRLATRRALPSVVAGVRREWVRQAIERNLWPAVLDGILWATWSWIGRPLFADEFRQPPPAGYPHLMDLRSIVSTGWYHERREGVPECYEAAALVRRDSATTDRFHLYLSGAGGTGKSCFLRSVYDTLANRDDVLAVWHRVDAPSSEWKDVAARVKQECTAALQRKLGGDRVSIDARGTQRLSDFLLKLLKTSRSSSWGISEVVIFLDQLERTFESGDEPEFDRLKNIARELMDLLVDVGVGQGVRVFIASRKQYLPDFLHSSQHAIKSGLHFNVLQSISEASDQKGFVEDVQNWCRREHLIDESVRIEPDAAYELAKTVSGHPLNMMLALIQLLSEGHTGRITTTVLQQSRPWERLFGFDERMMSKSDLDWYLMLAMAHARTEIVRFEEVWWRLRLVSPELSAQAERLGQSRFVERLWLLGHLGRTVYTRPHDDRPFGFLEFFHANLRDHLLRDVMSYGGIDARFSRRQGGTPPAWRALDRLWAAAHEWEQIQQLLTAEEVRSVMEHRAVVIERTHSGAGLAEGAFSLLFVRDSRDTRTRLQRAAKECFVLSALVHDDFGRWAFQEVFPDLDERVECCRRWMQRAGHETRARLLQYLIETDGDAARRYLVDLVLGDGGDGRRSWHDVGTQLAEPLVAARYRADVVLSVLETLGQAGLDREDRRGRFREFALAACAGEGHEVMSLLAACTHRLEGSPRAELRSLAPLVAAANLVDAEGLGGNQTTAPEPFLDVKPGARTQAKIQVVVGTELLVLVSHARVETWHQDLAEAFGIPLPAMEIGRGEVEPTEVELRINGRRVAQTELHPSRRRILKRHWDERHDFAARDAVASHDDTLGEIVYWFDDDYLAQIGWDRPGTTAEDAVRGWLDEQLRRHADAVIDLDVVNEFLRDVEVTTDVAQVFGDLSLHDFMQLIRRLVRERVPFGTPTGRVVLMQVLGDVAGAATGIDVVLQRVREHFGAELCKAQVDRSHGRLFGIEIDADLEEALTAEDAPPLSASPALARAMATAVRRHCERTLRDHDAMPVIKCSTALRLPLFRLLERFDARIVVLSASELPPEAPWVTAARLGSGLLAQTEMRKA